jgi:hypothetical protein
MDKEALPPDAVTEESVLSVDTTEEPDLVVGMGGKKEDGSVDPQESRHQAAAADTRAEGESRTALGGCAACLRIFKATEWLPPSARFTSLTCKASGEYCLEGAGASDRDVEGFADTLRQLPSRVALTLWRVRGHQTNRVYRFAFHGQFEEFYCGDLEAMSATQAQALADTLGQWAWQSGLDGVSLRGPFAMQGRDQQRRKLWATGSHAQIRDFLRQLKPVEDMATLDEVVIVPVHTEDEDRDLARLYVVVDLLVHRP